MENDRDLPGKLKFAIENGHRNSGFSHWKMGGFSIVMGQFTRGSLDVPRNHQPIRVTTSTIHHWLVVDLPLWKILVSWDDDSQYMEQKMFQTTNQIISTEQSYWFFRLFGNIRLHRHLCTEKLNVEESKWIPTSSHGLAETQWDKVWQNVGNHMRLWNIFIEHKYT